MIDHDTPLSKKIEKKNHCKIIEKSQATNGKIIHAATNKLYVY
jgi:hypothetical protein